MAAPPLTVQAWFGPAFAALDPALQRLHRDGGTLAGPVRIVFPTGLRGVIGRRIARRMGIPCDGHAHRLQVTVRSEAGALHWERRFDAGVPFASVFVPVGAYPDGYWVESTAALSLRLGVVIADGAWHWRHRATMLAGLALPAWLGPRVHGEKAVLDGRYRFGVALSLPLLGQVMAYAGSLSMEET
jgi:hypothetical protein